MSGTDDVTSLKNEINALIRTNQILKMKLEKTESDLKFAQDVIKTMHETLSETVLLL